MIFVGDVAIADDEVFCFVGFPPAFRESPICVNLEGAVPATDSRPGWGVYNTSAWLDSFAEFTLGPVFIGNNHIQDVPGGVRSTSEHADLNGYRVFGAGLSSSVASVSAVRPASVGAYALLGFGWKVIGCRPAKKDKMGVNRLDRNAVLRQLKSAADSNPNSKIVVVIHGNYEFEEYPQPAHRRLAKEAIELGAYAVIFHHPHIVGPIERHKGRTIAYSVGNWAFSYGRFFAGKLQFPSSSYHQIAVECSPDGDIVHHARFTPPITVTYERSERIHDASCTLIASFEGMSDDAYYAWFKRNRKKSKGLPIYQTADSDLSNLFRDAWVAIRQYIIDISAKAGLKPMRRKQ